MRWFPYVFVASLLAAIGCSSPSNKPDESNVGETKSMDNSNFDVATLVEFLDSIHLDEIQHDGVRGSTTGHFVRIAQPGVAQLAGSEFQLVLIDPADRALIAILPERIEPKANVIYSVSGKLSPVGHVGLMAGIVVDSITEIDQ